MLILYLLAKFHAMLISSMTKNYIVLNPIFSDIKRPFLIGSYTSVIYAISIRLRWAHILVNHLYRLSTTYTSLYV